MTIWYGWPCTYSLRTTVLRVSCKNLVKAAEVTDIVVERQITWHDISNLDFNKARDSNPLFHTCTVLHDLQLAELKENYNFKPSLAIFKVLATKISILKDFWKEWLRVCNFEFLILLNSIYCGMKFPIWLHKSGY